MLRRSIIPGGMGIAILFTLIGLACNIMRSSYESKDKWKAVAMAIVELAGVIIFGIIVL